MILLSACGPDFVAWSVQDVKPEAVIVAAMTSQAIATQDHFKPQHIANLLWAFARLDLAPSVKVLARLPQVCCASKMALVCFVASTAVITFLLLVDFLRLDLALCQDLVGPQCS